MKKSFVITTLLASALALTSCATMGLVESTRAESPKQYNKRVLVESVIAVGYPSQPIRGYEHAMILAGKNYSFIVKPVVSSDTPQDSFKTLFALVNLSALYIDTQYKTDEYKAKTKAKSNELVLNVLSDSLNDTKNIPAKVGLIVSQPLSNLKAYEQSLVQNLGFKCEKAIIEAQEHLICQRILQTTITIASAVQNIDNAKYKLKQPLTIEIDFNYLKDVKRRERISKFSPLAIVSNIDTLDIQVIGADIGTKVLSLEK